MSFVFWLPALCGALHVTEEFFWPGGFLDWFRTYRPENAFLHIVGTWRTQRHAPGLITGVLLNLPLCIGGFWYFLIDGDASFSLAATSLVVGASFDLWSNLGHRARSALMKRDP